MSMSELQPLRRSLSWRVGSSAVMGITGLLSRGFLYGLNRVETTNLPSFLKILDERRASSPQRGLLTVSNHVSVLDDPVMWGVLPLKYDFDPRNLRWGLGAHDICFKNKATSRFFSLGQVLPTHRLLHSPHGGLFQPTMTEAVRLLSGDEPSPPSESTGLTFTTGAGESFPSASAYQGYRNAWVHIFPEACVHQHPEMSLRYFKWGVSRLILESNPAPQLVPMFIDGTQKIMNEKRTKPRWLPRAGHRFRTIFGDTLDTDKVFGEQRAHWRHLLEKEKSRAANATAEEEGPSSMRLKDDPEAVQLRVEVAEAVRGLISHLREEAGYPPDEPSFAKAETWKREPSEKRFTSPVDGSVVHRE